MCLSSVCVRVCVRTRVCLYLSACVMRSMNIGCSPKYSVCVMCMRMNIYVVHLNIIVNSCWCSRFHTTQYPVLRIFQSARLTLHSLADLFNQKHLDFTRKHPATLQLMREDCSCTNIHNCLTLFKCMRARVYFTCILC